MGRLHMMMMVGESDCVRMRGGGRGRAEERRGGEGSAPLMHTNWLKLLCMLCGDLGHARWLQLRELHADDSLENEDAGREQVVSRVARV